MLSDEEKKAIVYLKSYCINDVLYDNKHYEQIKTILNLIEKLQKEIEELKEEDDANLAYYDQIYQNGIYTGQKAIEDKIKAKIEEVNAEELNLAFIISGVEYKEAITSTLQSLLEKE